MPKVIRLGDPTTHGGKVVSVGANHFTVDGIAVARVGDGCVCPIAGHVECKIVEGNLQHVIDGIAVAYEGNKTSCGATLIATTARFNSD